MIATVPHQRISSLTAPGHSAGSAASSASWSGCSRRATTALPIRCAVVSCPAKTSVSTIVTSSSSLSRAPSSSEMWTSAVSRSSAGSARRRATRPRMWLTMPRIASGTASGLSMAPSTSPQARQDGRSSSGTPTSSQITVIGSG
ncbi:hypothetical protein BJF78_20820 [Pseudonocardia sp. CNS-139]|nr:hypothetical protein BJF78_20820 [Pseudonocardia sp. CNS-139]